ncbi:MAG TPA: serine protease [Polyangiaceae bacterium]|nr:serine protease [Polyangiaceae bacterium]
MRRIAVSLTLAIFACAGAPHAPQGSPIPGPGPVSSSNPALAAPARGPDSTLSRAAVRAVLVQGLGAFLQRVELDDHPVVVGGKFHGFRIMALHDRAFWRSVDLRPGDVVTSVNGFPIERPDQAATVFDSLDLASELRVAYEREGQPREIVYSIAEDR